MKIAVLPLRKLTSDKLFLYAATSSKVNPEIKPTINERVVNKAASTWAGWEAAQGGWKKKVVTWGNKAISRIDYRENCLKSVMSIATYRRYHPDALDAKITVSHPASLDGTSIAEQITKLANEGQPRHRMKLIYSFILMPFTAPFMLVPVVPNLPFFYVAFRAWSHFRAMQGSAHLQQLIAEKRLVFHPSNSLSQIYDASGAMKPTELQRILVNKVALPGMLVEIERANEQLDRADAEAASRIAPEPKVNSEQKVTPEEEARNKERSRIGLHK